MYLRGQLQGNGQNHAHNVKFANDHYTATLPTNLFERSIGTEWSKLCPQFQGYKWLLLTYLRGQLEGSGQNHAHDFKVANDYY